MSRIVIALGGNALGKTPTEQLEKAQNTAQALVPLIIEGHELVICHGNGPQVGMINLAFEKSSAYGIPNMPFAECTAMSQGYIGYHLQQAIDAELILKGCDTPVITMLTQVVVDKEDPAFKNPTKPIGDFVSQEEAKKLMQESNDIYKEDAGRGWRRVVASPEPVSIYEYISLDVLLKSGQVVIAGGGGGIPIIKTEKGYKGVDAVIDKDFTAAKIAEMVDADYLFILTAVEKVAINFGQPNQEELSDVSVEKARQYISEGHFAPGSMLPKVEAALKFVESGNNRKALIGALDKAAETLVGKNGTRVFK